MFGLRKNTKDPQPPKQNHVEDIRVIYYRKDSYAILFVNNGTSFIPRIGETVCFILQKDGTPDQLDPNRHKVPTWENANRMRVVDVVTDFYVGENDGAGTPHPVSETVIYVYLEDIVA